MNNEATHKFSLTNDELYNSYKEILKGCSIEERRKIVNDSNMATDMLCKLLGISNENLPSVEDVINIETLEKAYVDNTKDSADSDSQVQTEQADVEDESTANDGSTECSECHAYDYSLEGIITDKYNELHRIDTADKLIRECIEKINNRDFTFNDADSKICAVVEVSGVYPDGIFSWPELEVALDDFRIRYGFETAFALKTGNNANGDIWTFYITIKHRN